MTIDTADRRALRLLDATAHIVVAPGPAWRHAVPPGHCRGERHPRAVLTDADVAWIRERHEAAGWGYRRIARWLGVAVSTVSTICRYESRYLPPC